MSQCERCETERSLAEGPAEESIVSVQEKETMWKSPLTFSELLGGEQTHPAGVLHCTQPWYTWTNSENWDSLQKAEKFPGGCFQWLEPSRPGRHDGQTSLCPGWSRHSGRICSIMSKWITIEFPVYRVLFNTSSWWPCEVGKSMLSTEIAGEKQFGIQCDLHQIT